MSIGDRVMTSVLRDMIWIFCILCGSARIKLGLVLDMRVLRRMSKVVFDLAKEEL